YLWSKGDTLAGLRIKANMDGKEISLLGNDPEVKKIGNNELQITWPLKTVPGKFIITCSERKWAIRFAGPQKMDWYLDLTTAAHAELPFINIDSNVIQCSFEKFNYKIIADQGKFSKPGSNIELRLHPTNNIISLQFDKGY
ncbi:MAG TPA: hypothetical protein VG847_00325, partial [Chitinophagaceae bacterium]|nr:hypothetical protein [Chitinophagaceae bacterium]